jgi:hypothetical protein
MRTRTIDLRGKVPGFASLEFIEAKVFDPNAPFALVTYTDGGRQPEFGLRLDLDKFAFLDRLDDVQKDEALRTAAPQIARIVALALRGTTGATAAAG